MTTVFFSLLLLFSCLTVVQAYVEPPTVRTKHIYLSPPNPAPYVNGAQTFTASVAGTSQQELLWSDTCGDTKATVGLHNTYEVASSTLRTCKVTATLKNDPSVSATSTVQFVASPTPSTSHPRLEITPEIIASMQAAGWNKSKNPFWQDMLTSLATARAETDKKWCFSYMTKCPAGSAPGTPLNWIGAHSTTCGATQWCDTGGTQGPTFDTTEGYAKFYAWMAQFIDDPKQKSNLKTASYEMLMWALKLADTNNPLTAQNCGSHINAFQDCAIATGNRIHQASGETWAQAVDLNYDRYTPADLKVVRDVFSAWANLEESTYVTGFGCLSPFPPAVGNDAVPTDRKCMRWEMNNLGTAAYQTSFQLSQVLDAKDDVPTDSSKAWNAFSYDKAKSTLTVNSLRGYGYLNMNGWAYVRWLLLEDPGITSKLTGLDPAGLGEGQGGGSPESSEYAPNFGYTYMALWAMHTAGLDDPTNAPQMNLETSSAWDNTVWYFLNSISPTNHFTDNYMGYNYDISVYGDNGSPYGFQTQNYKSLVPIGLRDMYANHDPVELNAVRWLMRHAFYGGCGKNSPDGACGSDSQYLHRRLRSTIGSNDFQTVTDLFMVLGDPTARPCDPAQPGCSNPNGEADPRTDTSYNHDWHAPGWGKTYSRTAWKSGAWFIDGCSWMSIDHQTGDCGQTELWYKGGFVFSPFTTYMNPVSSATDWKGAGMLIPNPDDGPDQAFHASPSYLQATSMLAARGAEMTQITQATPKVLEYSAPNYTVQYQESTDERNYTHWNVKANNVTYAARTDVFLKDSATVVVYDTGKTVNPLASGLHKSVAFDTVDMPTLTGQTAKLAHGSLTTIIPEGSDYSVLVCSPPRKGGGSAPGNCNGGVQGPSPARFMTTVTSASNVDHFLNVLEGSNGRVTPMKKIAAQSGTPIDGVELDGDINTVVSFLQEPVVHGGKFTTVMYQVPSTVTTHYLVGLKPSTSYSYKCSSNNGVDTLVVSADASGANRVTSDGSGSIYFVTVGSSAPRTLHSGRESSAR